MSKLIKYARVEKAAVQSGDMALINALAVKELTEEEVYIFRVVLCDNKIDRDNEAFAAATIRGLAPMFVGKTGITDHNWRAGNQIARIYKTEVATPGGEAATGEPLTQLIAYCYMLRMDSTSDIISQIEGGILREVSVGCACNDCKCSICGKSIYRDSSCPHWPGREYDGKKCYGSYTGAKDAYEFSFVAVPAQPGAGVTKKAKLLGTDEEEPAEKPEPPALDEDLELAMRLAEADLLTYGER